MEVCGMSRIISDTREKKNQHVLKYFEEHGVEYVIRKLDYGDYQDEERTEICIDRKQNIAELAKNCTVEAERFKKELERAQRANSRLVILVEQNRYKDRDEWKRVEDIADLMLWSSPHTTIRGEKVFRVLSAWVNKYDIEVRFCDKRVTGRKILEILYGE